MNFKKGSPESEEGIPSGCLLHFLDRLQKKTGSNAQFSFNAA